MSKKIIEKINELHNQNKHQKIIELIYSINENERDYEIILLFARALNNVHNYDEALDNLMYIREEGLFDPLWYYRTGYAYYHKNEKNTAKQYFSKAIELFENYDKKNIENFSEISNNIKNLYSLCFENEDK
ncbi:tetratricopeptide repeat protein [Brachyspira hyodysenteriae]|nr:tetratricopeptide repeat protein [Brachyspira hyodysenteriae]